MRPPRSIVAVALLVLGTAARAPGQAPTGWLGLAWRLEPDGRARVLRVWPGAPAERAGLRPGDRVLAVDGQPAARLLAWRLAAGDTLRLEVERDGRRRTVTLVAAPRPRLVLQRCAAGAGVVRCDTVETWIVGQPDTAALARLRAVAERQRRLADSLRATLLRLRPTIEHQRRWADSLRLALRRVGRTALAGAQLAPLPPAAAANLRLPAGLLVLDVVPESPAARAGLQPGDVLLRADGRPLRSWADLQAAVRTRPDGAAVRLEVHRRGRTATLTLPREP